MDPQQELFTEIRQRLIAMYPDRVYDGFLPPDGTPYPFVYLGESSMTDDLGNKTKVNGKVLQVIHVWHNDPNKRGSCSQMLLDIKDSIRTLERTRNYRWYLKGINQQTLPDNTTTTPLLHGVLELEYTFF